MEFEFLSLLFLGVCVFAFLAGFVDAIVGGGGLVTVPFLFVGFPSAPVSMVIGTNRFSSIPGTIVAARHYLRHTEIPIKMLLLCAFSAAAMSYTGAAVSRLLKPDVLKPLMLMIMIAVAAYTYMKKNLGHADDHTFADWRLPALAVLVCSVLGFYNGFFGPGTGSLLVFAFVSIIGFSFLKSSAMAKIVNVVADISSLFFFITNGFVFWKLAIPMAFCQIAGSVVGSRMAVLKGNRFIRYVFLVVVGGLILRFGYDVWRMTA